MNIKYFVLLLLSVVLLSSQALAQEEQTDGQDDASFGSSLSLENPSAMDGSVTPDDDDRVNSLDDDKTQFGTLKDPTDLSDDDTVEKKKKSNDEQTADW